MRLQFKPIESNALNKSEFSKNTAECLARSGWSQDSVVDTWKYEQDLREAGFTVHNAALDFLKTYGGLRVHHPHPKVAEMDDEIHFDPGITGTHIRSIDVRAYGKVVGRQLCPIGEAARGYLTS